MHKSSIENYKSERVDVHQIVLQDNGVPRGYRNHAEAWAASQRGDWMMRIAAFAGIPRAMLVRAACACAREALIHVPLQLGISARTEDAALYGAGRCASLRALETSVTGAVIHHAADRHAQNNLVLRVIETAEAWSDCESYKNRHAAEDAWQAASLVYTDGAHGYAKRAATSASLAIIYPYEAENTTYNASMADACVSGNAGRAASLLKSANIIRAMIPWHIVADAIGGRTA